MKLYRLGIFTLYGLLTVFAFGISPQEIARKAFPSAVSLTLFDESGNALKAGSGFFVRDGIIATNYHVIEGASSGIAKSVGKENKLVLQRVLAANAKVDLALVEVAKTDIPSLTISNGRRLSIGQKVYAIGNPVGLEGTFSEGIISSIREIGEDYYIQMTAPISSGSSGGPVLNEHGLVVGVSVATVTNGQNLNFAVPGEYLSKLISEIHLGLVSGGSGYGKLNLLRFTGMTLFETSANSEQSSGSTDRSHKQSTPQSGLYFESSDKETGNKDKLIMTR
jgi:S1-C subfamily serine protease